MPIKSNITDRRSRRDKFKREVTLLSGGFAKPEAFPNGKITVFPWDSEIDAWLQTQTNRANALERERLLYDLTAKLCNLNGCPIEDFVLGDVNVILLTSRTIANQSKIQYLSACPKCNEEEIAEIAVPEELKPVGQKQPDYKGFDSVTLDDCKDVVDVRPLRVKDEIAIATRTQEQRAKISNHIAHIIAPIISVNGTQADRLEEMLEWYEAISPHDAKQLEDFIDASSPHFSPDVPHKCDGCGHLYNFRLTLDQDFFRSGRMGTSGREVAANL